ncbi:MAG: hypothetical protein Q7K57_59060, partial [Burkholderiaceae bacterium]|nr:hypothetical protein [Burkholderiaceae bacterium]
MNAWTAAESVQLPGLKPRPPPQVGSSNILSSIRPIPGHPTETTSMFSHVMVGVSDLEASKKFYDAVLGTLG